MGYAVTGFVIQQAARAIGRLTCKIKAPATHSNIWNGMVGVNAMNNPSDKPPAIAFTSTAHIR